MHACRTQQERLFYCLEERHVIVVEIHEVSRVAEGVFRDNVASRGFEYIDHGHFLTGFACHFHP